MNRSRDVPKMTAGRAALVALLDRYLLGLLDPFVTLLEAHKLMYFMQVAGKPLKLRFTKGHYGPYAENLRHVLHAVEGHFVSGYADGGDVFGRRLQLVPGALEEGRRRRCMGIRNLQRPELQDSSVAQATRNTRHACIMSLSVA